ncbi:gluconokinase [Arthrobacter sp. 7Tela_A1]|uniref:gluconokinase n=1 Tax=Arthrobacter sp. 7Tela_A1 TaxID=3093745 RepID=UPI003BB5E8AA
MPLANNSYPPVVVMGVQGCGKSTAGRAIAATLGLPFLDGDDLHPASNKAKMASGHPLTDEDREPWLRAIGAELEAGMAKGTATVVACSSLKRQYRDLIRSYAPTAQFVHLHGSRELIAERLSKRDHEYMPPTLLDSQFATLEPLGEDEAGIRLDITLSLGEIAAAAAASVEPSGH